MRMYEATWSKEPPTKVGNYWFCGWFSRLEKRRAPAQMHYVRVIWFADRGNRVFKCDGIYFDEQRSIGKWTPAYWPFPPRLNDLD